MDEMRETVKVTIGQIGNHDIPSQDIFNKNQGFEYNDPKWMWRKVRKAIQVASQDQADFLVFPEITIPRSYLKSHIPTICNEHNLIIIGGVEFYHKYLKNGKKYIQNEAFIAVPGSETKIGLRDRAMVWRIPKIYPANGEEKMIKEADYHFSPGNKIYIFKSKEYGNWAVLICVDYINLPIQQILQKKIQTLFIVALNKDLNYYYSISDALHRILYCNIVVCNVANYGGSHVYTPYREPYKREVLKLQGNKIETAITVELPLKILKEIQQADRRKDFDGFVRKPSDYEYIQ